jgi:hypothetical protein
MVILESIAAGAILGLKIITCSAVVLAGVLLIVALISKDE